MGELVAAARQRVDRLEGALMLAYAGDPDAARIEMDEGIRLRTAGIDPRSLASVLVGAAFSALEYEARKPASSLDGSLAHSMAFIWCTAIYGEARWSRMDAPAASGD